MMGFMQELVHAKMKRLLWMRRSTLLADARSNQYLFENIRSTMTWDRYRCFPVSKERLRLGLTDVTFYSETFTRATLFGNVASLLPHDRLFAILHKTLQRSLRSGNRRNFYRDKLQGEGIKGKINSPDAHHVIRTPADNEDGDNGHRHFQSAYSRSTEKVDRGAAYFVWKYNR